MRAWVGVDVPRVPGGEALAPVEVWDTAKDALVPLPESPELKLYVCGITPYDATHLGHAATYLLFDVLQRVARDAGRTVRYVQNVTDVDDPLLERAAATGEDWVALAERETELFREDMQALRMLAPEAYVGAVEAIPRIVAMVQALLDAGAAYLVDDDVYFSVAAAERFGEVSGYDAPTMLRLSGERGGDPQRPGKKDPLDPLLWRAAREGEPSWPSALGPGRPGWHVECAAIAVDYLGSSLDVQGGGTDLVFPHHEMSAAHVSALTHDWPYAVAGVHQAMVGYQGEKMSKSRGNLVFVSALRRDGVDPMAIRLALLAHDHRHDWEWHDTDLASADERLGRWRAALRRATGPSSAPVVARLRQVLRAGLDAPAALAVVDGWAAEEGTDPAAPAEVATALDALLGIL